MKICHITSGHDQRDGRIFQKECVSLAQVESLEISLVSYGKSFVEKNVNVVGVPKSYKKKIGRILKANKHLIKEAIKIDADIYHLQDPELLLYAQKLKKLGKKVVFDSHEDYVEQLKERPGMNKVLCKILSGFYSVYQRFIFSKIDGLIFPCSKNRINPFNGMCRNFTYVNNFPIIENYSYNIEKKENKEELFKVCYVGSITENRGITNLIKACYKAQVQLILAGNFVLSSYRIKLESMPEYSIVDYRGVVPYEEIGEIYNEASLGAATLLNVGQYGKYDNFSTKIYEYMLYRLPVIMNSYPYADSILEKHKFGIAVNTRNIDDIADGIKFIKENRCIAKNMGNVGFELVNSEFDWNFEALKIVELYELL